MGTTYSVFLGDRHFENWVCGGMGWEEVRFEKIMCWSLISLADSKGPGRLG
jgi:hypothetical protein